MKDNKEFDVIIIGGSYAGLSAAMALGRSMRNVLIIDSGKPCNRYTPHSHNFITHDGSVPGEIAAKAKEQVLKYDTVKFYQGMAVSGKKTENGFEIAIDSGEKFSSKKLVFATGVKDIFPDIKGFQDCWGKTVIHCPYCHGYEFKGAKTAIIANGERAFHMATLINNLTNKLTIITQGKHDFKEEQLIKLQKNKIQIIEKEVAEIQHQNGEIKNLIFKDGTKEDFDAAYAAIPFEQHSDIPKSLGCEITEMGHIKVDLFQKTTIPGIYACGDNSSPMRSVANAVATGNLTGAMVNNEITVEQF
ncbi:NAD(P)/FAD-dependent oxidoreductase [Flavobacterium dauae]|uniref:NAD(P)/FAD-dependent oxidoreductase n=1 Tax=Flavobacterium dauae TaxID=1563479 RepID=UPI00101B4F44|nr:NAD(P)/FAD-dependent oxidoreductase [Flavobacterium dauae]WLD23099.1 NAD(P)/FAD-dependent oxidoreductase [Flavobacterium dauae]